MRKHFEDNSTIRYARLPARYFLCPVRARDGLDLSDIAYTGYR